MSSDPISRVASWITPATPAASATKMSDEEIGAEALRLGKHYLSLVGSDDKTSSTDVVEDDPALVLIAEMKRLEAAAEAVSDRAEKILGHAPRGHSKAAGSRFLEGRARSKSVRRKI